MPAGYSNCKISYFFIDKKLYNAVIIDLRLIHFNYDTLSHESIFQALLFIFNKEINKHYEKLYKFYLHSFNLYNKIVQM